MHDHRRVCRYHYKVGSEASGWSKVFSFRSQVDATTLSSHSPQTHLIIGDLGSWSVSDRVVHLHLHLKSSQVKSKSNCLFPKQHAEPPGPGGCRCAFSASPNCSCTPDSKCTAIDGIGVLTLLSVADVCWCCWCHQYFFLECGTTCRPRVRASRRGQQLGAGPTGARRRVSFVSLSACSGRRTLQWNSY